MVNDSVLDKNQEWYKHYQAIEQNTVSDRCHGCILGSFIGDTVGSFLEFMRQKPTRDQVDAAMKMPGGGHLNIGPGQGTDDTEMQMTILTALCDTNHGKSANERKLDVDNIAKWYQNWAHTLPFDFGSTIYHGLRPLYRSKKTYEAKNSALKNNYNSKSNGSLMRCMPIAVWTRDLDDYEIQRAVHAECEFTHPNPYVKEVVFIYVITLSFLFKFNPEEDPLNE